MRLWNRVFVGAGMLAAVGACDHGDPVSSAAGPSGKAVLLTGSAKADKLPGGSANVTTTFGGLAAGIRDQLGRKQTDPVRARRTRNFRGTAHYWTWTKETRDGSPEFQDPRLPAINPASRIVNANTYFELYQPEGAYPNAEFWEFYFIVQNLAPSTPHEVAFVHRRLNVNGELDAVERVLNGTVTQPDQLVMGPGTRATINTDWVPTAPAGCADFPGVTANPFVVSTDPSDASGRLQDFDKCWKSGNGIWTKAEYDQQTKSMVGRADDTTYTLPNYNYIEVWQGAFGTGTLMGRVQIAQDLAPDGTPIKNGYPPFPAPGGAHSNTQMGPIPATDAATAYPISNTLKTALPGAIGVPEQVVATLTNLQRLEAPVYKAWFINPTTGAAKEAVGTYQRQHGSGVETVASTSTFKGGAGTITFTAAYNPAVHGPYSDSLTFLLITKEDDAAATTPSAAQVLWVKIFKVPPATVGGAFAFGSFNREAVTGTTPPSAQSFVPQGLASGGILGESVSETRTVNGKVEPITIFVGSVIQMQFTNLQRPPKGYEYLAYFRFKRDTTETTPTTVEQDSVLYLIGSPVGPSGESLANADVAPTGGNLGPQSIRTARVVLDTRSRGQELCDFDRFRLYLAPKGGVVSEPQAVIFDIALPERVTKAFACR